MNTKNILILCWSFSMIFSVTQAAAPKACQGVSKKCTKDQRFDKTIDGETFSCYKCTQTVCKSGGSGPIAGTETSTVCESKPVTGRALIESQQSTQFDEADALFGKRTVVKEVDPPENTSESTVRKTKRSKKVEHKTNKTKKVKPNSKQGATRPTIKKLKAPSKVNLFDVNDHNISISWVDNSDKEYGVAIERGQPIQDRGGINYQWQHIFNVEERIDSNIKGIGWRTDTDDGLKSNTTYCYRLRAYDNIHYSPYSSSVCTQTQYKEH